MRCSTAYTHTFTRLPRDITLANTRTAADSQTICVPIKYVLWCRRLSWPSGVYASPPLDFITCCDPPWLKNLSSCRSAGNPFRDSGSISSSYGTKACLVVIGYSLLRPSPSPFPCRQCPKHNLFGEAVLAHPRQVPCPSHPCHAEQVWDLLDAALGRDIFIFQVVPDGHPQNSTQKAHV